MGARKRTRGKALGSPAMESVAEEEELSWRVQGEVRLLDLLSSVEVSSAAVALAEEVRGSLRDICVRQQDLLQAATATIDALTREGRKREKTIRLLQHKLDAANYELRRALGIRARSKDDAPETPKSGDDAKSDEPECSPKKKNGGKRGAPKGHRGASRKIPDRFDRERVIGPVDTCDCGCGIVSPTTEFDVRYVEDVPPVCAVVTREIYLRGRCAGCGKVLTNPQTKGPPVVTGPNVAVHLAMLNQMGMTFGKLASLSTDVLGIPLSRSGALGIVNRAVASIEGVYGEIGESLPSQPWLNGDETGWKVRGVNGYVWILCNKRLAYFHHDFSRSGDVVKEILGENFPGVVICDFYGGYNWLDKTQRCLVHLLRDIKKEREILKGSKMLKKFDQAVRDFITEGLEIQAMPEDSRKDKALRKLEKRLDRLACMKVTRGKATTLVKRIAKYRDDVIRFVSHPGVEFHNNRAERQLRPLVINRKISFGSDTEAGARRYCILHSVIETCKLQGINPIDFLRVSCESGGLGSPLLAGTDPPPERQAG